MKVDNLRDAVMKLKEVPFLMKTEAAERVLDCVVNTLTDQESRIEKLERELLAVSRG